MIISNLGVQNKILNNDVGAFEEMFKMYYRQLCVFVNSILHDPDQSEEIVQEFFYVYWKNRKQIGVKISLKSYLYKSVKNNALAYLRHKKIEQGYAQYIEKSSEIEFSSDKVEDDELEKLILDTFSALPQRSQQIFNLSRQNGLTYREIADSLSISVKTVEADMTKALSAFRQVIEKYNRGGTYEQKGK